MLRLAGAEGARTANDADRWRRSSRALTMTPTVDAAMNSTSLKSRTSPALSRAMALASVARSASSVDRSCSPQSHTTMGADSALPNP